MISTFQTLAMSQFSTSNIPQVDRPEPAIDQITKLAQQNLSGDKVIRIFCACEEINSHIHEKLEEIIKAALRQRCHIEVRILSQSIREAMEAIVPAATVRPPAGTNPVSIEIGNALTEFEIMSNLKVRVKKNQQSQQKIIGLKRLFRTAGRPESAIFEYRASAISPDNDILIIDIEDRVTMQSDSYMLLTPRQHGTSEEEWQSFLLDGRSPLASSLRLSIDILYNRANRRPIEIKDYDSFLQHLIDEWRVLRNKLEGIIKRNELTEEYNWLLGLLGH